MHVPSERKHIDTSDETINGKVRTEQSSWLFERCGEVAVTASDSPSRSRDQGAATEEVGGRVLQRRRATRKMGGQVGYDLRLQVWK